MTMASADMANADSSQRNGLIKNYGKGAGRYSQKTRDSVRFMYHNDHASDTSGWPVEQNFQGHTDGLIFRAAP